MPDSSHDITTPSEIKDKTQKEAPLDKDIILLMPRLTQSPPIEACVNTAHFLMPAALLADLSPIKRPLTVDSAEYLEISSPKRRQIIDTECCKNKRIEFLK